MIYSREVKGAWIISEEKKRGGERQRDRERGEGVGVGRINSRKDGWNLNTAF